MRAYTGILEAKQWLCFVAYLVFSFQVYILHWTCSYFDMSKWPKLFLLSILSNYSCWLVCLYKLKCKFLLLKRYYSEWIFSWNWNYSEVLIFAFAYRFSSEKIDRKKSIITNNCLLRLFRWLIKFQPAIRLKSFPTFCFSAMLVWYLKGSNSKNFQNRYVRI